MCFCERGVDAFEFSIVCFSDAFCLSFGNMFLGERTRCFWVFDCSLFCYIFLTFGTVFARGDLLLLSVRLFVFLLPFFLSFGIVLFDCFYVL